MTRRSLVCVMTLCALGLAACGEEPGNQSAGKDATRYPTNPEARLSPGGYCGGAGDKGLIVTTEWYWSYSYSAADGNGLLLCAGRDTLDHADGEIYLRRDGNWVLPRGEDGHGVVVPGSGALRITSAPTGKKLTFSEVEHAVLRVRAEDGRLGSVALNPSLERLVLILGDSRYPLS